MNKKITSISLVITTIFLLVLLVSFTKSKQDNFQDPKDPKITNLKLPEGFHAERLYGPSANGEGSWVSMTFDDKGRIIASDQYGSLYRLKVPKIGDTITKTSIEEIYGDTINTKSPVTIGYAHGLLWAFNSLYVMINNRSNDKLKRGSGLYRLQDTNGDDTFDKITLIKELDGEGEHGPHSVILSPDKKSIYVVAGNFTKIPKLNAYRNFPESKIDNLFPLIKDPNGHDNTVQTQGGWVAHLDSTGTNWELIASGFRNPFDISFNDQGDLFAYDSDMEWDFGTP
ncbi:MAG: heme-binding protein, partial [Bacteroidetes bacterium]|nr:heme-binding protein [Bacteroidota bacterium]